MRILICLIFVLINFGVFSQMTFDKRYGNYSLLGGTNLYTIDNNFIVTGDNGNMPEGETSVPKFMIIDDNGNVLHDKVYETEVCYFHINNYVKTKDNDFVGVGFTFGVNDTCGASPEGYAVHGGLYYHKIDKTGKIIWKKTVIDSTHYNSNTGGDILQLNDGNYLMLGTFESVVSIYNIDDNGNIIWIKKLEGTLNAPFFIEQVNDGFICKSGSRFFKINENGDIIWNRILNDIGSARYSRDKDGGFVFSKQVYNNPNYPKTKLIKTNQEMEVQWNNVYDSLYAGGYAITSTNDGNYIVAGREIAKLDSLGNKLWQKKLFSEPTFGKFYNDVIETNDGGLLFTGRDYNYVVTKTDCEGNLVWNHKACPTYSESEEFTIYPNPIGDNFTISIPESQSKELLFFNLYDIAGKKVKEIKFQDEKSIQIETINLSNGVYIYSILNDNKFLQTGKLVKE